MLPTIHLIRLHRYPIFHQLQLEEALLRADSRDWCLINDGSSDAIVMGISGAPETLINKSLLQKAPVPVIRRFSGGGTVYVDKNTCFVTFICNHSTTHVTCCSNTISQWTEKLYQPVFHNLNFQLKENDYVLDQKKFGGNAQYIRKDRWLHHSSLLWDFDGAAMNYLLHPLKTPAYREQRPHTEFLCRLREHFPNKEWLKRSIETAIASHFSIRDISLDSILDILNTPHRRATERLS